MVEATQKSTMKNVQSMVKKLFTDAIQKRFNVEDEAIVTPITNIPGSDYKIPTAITLFHAYKSKQNSFGFSDPTELAKEIIKSIPANEIIETVEVNKQNQLIVTISQKFLEKEIALLLTEGVNVKSENPQTIAVDFSAPNIAKELHVGHLRSTVMGESISRVLEFLGHDVKRINHIGDWGSTFGMLIAHMKEEFPDFLEKQPQLSDLESFYVTAKKKFKENETFKKLAQEKTVLLQKGDEESLKAWKMWCDLSRQEYQKIYKRLNVTNYECGESFYNSLIPGMVKELEEKGIIQLIDGAKCVVVPGYKKPLVAVKSDGGYGYDSTDLAAIKYRIQTLNCQKLIYLTDAGQSTHFEMVFKAAEMAGWLKKPIIAQHLGFGLVLKEDGTKFSTSDGESVRLMTLLNKAKDQAKEQILKRQQEQMLKQLAKPKEEPLTTATRIEEKDVDEAAEKIGMAAIKYFDQRLSSVSNYCLNFDQMLESKGNTAVYLLYAYARLCSIIKKSGMTEQDIKKAAKEIGFKITHEHEATLAMTILRFPETLDLAVKELALHKITDFIYEIASKVAEGYSKYDIVGTENQTTRILLCEAIKKVLKQALYLVGIEPLEKI